MALPCVNRFSQLADGDDSVADGVDSVAGVPEANAAGVPEASAAGLPGANLVDISEVSRKLNGQRNKDRRLRVATWNFSGLCSLA